MTPYSVQIIKISLIYFMLLYMICRMTGGGGGGGGDYPLNALRRQVTDYSVHTMPWLLLCPNKRLVVPLVLKT